ncbi:MAG: alanine racemase [Patiriisocius sp.]
MGIAKLKIDLGAVKYNYNYYKSLLLPDTKMMVVSKASSYGNGELEIVQILEELNIAYLAVALTEEGIFFRKKGVKSRILVFLTDEQDFDAIVENCLEPSIFSTDILKAFLNFLEEKGLKKYPIHLKIDTGMNRLGFKEGEIPELLQIKDDERIRVASIFSHLIASEEKSKDHITHAQINLFEKIKRHFEEHFDYKILSHILNTRGISRFNEKQYDMVRLGIGLYGYSGLEQDDLRSVSILEADILQVKRVLKGEFIGYGGENPQEEDITIAVLSIGYADGLSRLMGNGNGHVIINDYECPYIGNICMDITLVDVSNVPCKRGDKAEIFGNKISIENVAKTMNTIPYEVFTSISKRVKRVFVKG